MGVGSSAAVNWLSSLNWQIDFYKKAKRQRRRDTEFDYAWFEGRYERGLRAAVRPIIRVIRRRLRGRGADDISQEWVNDHASSLWDTRALLEDALSRMLFDSMLILACTSYRQFYFPRIDYDDLVSIVRADAFVSDTLPADYLGLPLQVFTVDLHHDDCASRLVLVSTREMVNSINSSRQYLIRRESVDFTPAADNVVFDCGACIGDVSVLMAGFVGGGGEVHLFDPVPLHTRYCALQASLNSALSHVFHFNTLAIAAGTGEITGSRRDAASISPAGIAVDGYATTSLDDYVSSRRLSRVDFIKMDIEGAEMAALAGASGVLSAFAPKLAISAYHKPEHLWEIPARIKSQDPRYRIFFGHHAPVPWESVYYACR